MVKGLDSFRRWFAGYEECYAVIGGTACDLIMSETGRDFRATKDIDLVLIIEALTPEFCAKFWEFVDAGGYEHRSKSDGKPQFYRFSHPSDLSFPAMIELFSRKDDAIELKEGAVLTPISLEESAASLSAILLDENYYRFLKRGKYVLEGISLLDSSHIIPFKMKAWLDLSKRQKEGESIDGRDIRKHRNDVFRLAELLSPGQKIDVSPEIKSDIAEFLKNMKEESIDTSKLGIRVKADELLKIIAASYGLDSDIWR